MQAQTDFADRVFHATRERCERMADVVLRHVKSEAALRVLDLGCGTGDQVFSLAGRLPAARLTGIDVSAANVEIAREGQRRRGLSERVRFEAADYMTSVSGPFDVITADSVVHLLETPDELLFRKIGRDLDEGGLFINSMPVDGMYNRALGLARRVLRGVRSPLTDWLAVRVAAVLHGREMPEELLRERIEYIYCPPRRLAGRTLHGRVKAWAGLDVIAQYDVPSASPAQLKHVMTVFQKASRGNRSPLQPR